MTLDHHWQGRIGQAVRDAGRSMQTVCCAMSLSCVLKVDMRCQVRVLDLTNIVSGNSKTNPILTLFVSRFTVQLGYTPT